MSDRRDRRVAYLLLLAMSACFGGTWVAGKLAVEEVPPFTTAALRFGLATVLLWAWARRLAPVPRPARADLPLVAVLGVTAVAGYNALFLYGLKLAPASDGAIIVPGLAPVFTALIAWPVLRERIGGRGAAGLALAFAGLLLVMNPSGDIGARRLLGHALFVAGALCWGLYLVIGRAAIARFGPVGATFWATATGTAMLLPFALLERGWEPVVAADAAAWISIAYLGVFGTVLAFVFFYEGVRRIGSTRAASFALLVPIFGVIGSVSMLGEELHALTIAGGAIVLGGLWLVQNRRRPRTAARARPVLEH